MSYIDLLHHDGVDYFMKGTPPFRKRLSAAEDRGHPLNVLVTTENGYKVVTKVYAAWVAENRPCVAGLRAWTPESEAMYAVLASQQGAVPPAEVTLPTQAAASALDVQVAGSHYKDCKIQPIEYVHANDLDFFQGNIVKYATRHKAKNGAADLQKVIHYAQLALELQYGIKP